MPQFQPGAPAYFRDFFETPHVMLAPMAGVSDAVFRQLCVEQGADLTFTEMVSAKGLAYENQRTEDLLALAPNEVRVSAQLFGHEPAVMAAEAARVAESLGDRLFAIDINMGCPAPKIAKKGDGSALMKSPDLAAEIVRAIKVATTAPLTVKFRRGFDEGTETCVEFAKVLEGAGADALSVHGRFAMQYYRGVGDRGAIARVKAAVSVPVTGNGDIKSGADALAMIEETGCDAVMVGRAAEGNPWLFAQVKAALTGETEPPAPSLEERLAIALRHAEMCCQLPGGAARMRKHAMSYVAGYPGASTARAAICACNNIDDFRHVFERLAEYASRPL